MITQDTLKQMFNYDPETGIFTWKVSRGPKKKGDIAGTLTKDGYIRITVNKRPYYAQQLACLYMTGEWPEHEMDHENRITYDNRWCNIRNATKQENLRNRKAWSKSGYLGVSWNRGKWQVYVVNSNGESISGGRFEHKDLELAVKSANTLRQKLHGELAVLEVFNGVIPSIEDLNNE